MDKPIEFRRQARGYNRDDVNSFISRENIRFNKLEEGYNSRIKELEKEAEDLKARLNESEAVLTKIDELEEEILSLKNSVKVKDEVIAEKDAIIEGLKNAVDSANEKIDIANGIIDDLKNKPAPAPEVVYPTPDYDDSIIEKAEKYDAICEKVDEILAFAKAEAEKIIAEAVEVRRQANKKSSSTFKSEIAERSGSIIEDIKRGLRRPFKK